MNKLSPRNTHIDILNQGSGSTFLRKNAQIRLKMAKIGSKLAFLNT